MRKHLILFGLLLLAPLAASAQKKSSAGKNTTPVLDLEEALRQKAVSLTVTGTGGHQGPSLKVICTNLKGKLLRLRIPRGQFMEPSDSTFQTLVVAEEQTLLVRTKVPAEATLSTFCAQSGDRSPLTGSLFAVGALAPEQLRNLLNFISEKGKINESAAQCAVWCLTSGGSLGSIGDPELTRFTAELLGKKPPGYKIRHQTVEEIPGERASLGKALLVEGNFQYFLEKDEILVMHLLDGEGKYIKQISKEETMKAGEHRSGLRLEVWNLTPGHYIVRLQTKGGRVIKDIEVDF
ncbi:MAG: hypothetical protein KDC61_22000 [Saprospiraceae bacterium]|nr:hypothetical protein [Saprospiraceae bacterium]